MLVHDIPSSEGVRNGLKRAKRLVGAAYTPVRNLPTVEFSVADGKRTYHDMISPAFLPLKGLPYSSVRRVEKYIGYNVSFETFLSALSNPDSVVYTKPIEGTGQNVHCHYGIVCSCFVSEVLDLPYRTPCLRIPLIPGVTKVDTGAFENLRLLDVVLHVKKHSAIITDIERDENGKVQFITVSESVMPFCRAVRYTREEFTHYWFDQEYGIYRYDGVDRITYEPDPFLPIPEDGPVEKPFINRTLMTDYGNKANYRLDETVEFSVFDPKFDRVSVKKPDGTTDEISVQDGKAVYAPASAGFYEAYAVSGNEKSAPVEFAVTDLRIMTNKEAYRPGEEILVRYENSADDALLAWQFNRCASDRGCGGGFFTDKPSYGKIALQVPEVEEDVELYLMARNRYGVYTSKRMKIKRV